jgi:hypothetical protein
LGNLGQALLATPFQAVYGNRSHHHSLIQNKTSLYSQTLLIRPFGSRFYNFIFPLVAALFFPQTLFFFGYFQPNTASRILCLYKAFTSNRLWGGCCFGTNVVKYKRGEW